MPNARYPETLDAIVAEYAVRIPHLPEKQRLQTIAIFSELMDLINEQISFWQRHSNGLQKIHTHFPQIQEMLQNAAAQNQDSIARDQIYQAGSRAQGSACENVYSDTALARFLAGLQEKDPSGGLPGCALWASVQTGDGARMRDGRKWTDKPGSETVRQGDDSWTDWMRFFIRF